ncbi:MAG: methylmalonyl-CoA mutase family protein [Deltaproteobacteria bacterium]|nr:methylmalonyl-CoA mutase family protein [Deltaproteobacteria bacterium]MBW1957600.1 methylmalonyl-CoA mutase family protein [Deltaproteobacteria bacterium]MBW2014198.1 methylmalonyl-CoA mutase family protein [Deltaproteobacteria bacterium]MBW2088040.1 methylmalonyl-CoA mutase family protein [Deltaproteobacteria bacterium]MBW2321176.1 methylmalonyl-CoA mutase family protein [Deltaproteobacteria bacterium]
MSVEVYKPEHHIRVVTATSLFDGHDASINITRRLLQDTGVEVIHLGHNRSAQEIVDAAIQEDVQGVAVSSYQGGHVEFFKYVVDLLKAAEVSHIKIFGGGGGVIVPHEIRELEEYGVTKIYSPEDGAKMGLQGMINHMVKLMDFSTVRKTGFDVAGLTPDNTFGVANLITAVELAKEKQDGHLAAFRSHLLKKIGNRKTPTIGITGTGGSGKSSLTDELILRMLHDLKDIKLAIISSDPSRRKTGGALLGDRIRMNAISNPRVYMRSLATRRSGTEIPHALAETLDVVKAAGFDLVIAETAGIGQGDSNIVDMVDVSIYVMTGEFGAATQLEKIDMLDFADLIVVNKFEKRGSQDAVREVRKQVQRNRKAWNRSPEEMPVYGTIASKFNDDGVTALYHAVINQLAEKTGIIFTSTLSGIDTRISTSKTIIIPPECTRYLAEISETVRSYHRHTKEQADAVRKAWHLKEAAKAISGDDLQGDISGILSRLKTEIEKAETSLDPETIRLLDDWKEIKKTYSKDDLTYRVRNREIRVPLFTKSLAHTRIPKIVLPKFKDPGEIYAWLREENVSGRFPFTAGVFPLKRVDEDPTRMFAGEGDPIRTNNRFKLLSANYEAKRLSTAFDSVTLYGYDPDSQPDIYGKVGTSGVSICTIDDVKLLYDGFNLCAPNTSVSMTINGPAPIMLAMFLNTAIDQQVTAFSTDKGRNPTEKEYKDICSVTLPNVRGTIQADILKEDQGQNTCIFSIEFALKMMGDIQEYFIKNNVQNFYSVSISGYHIAEAGANPITQLAFTLANGFTYVEYYLSRGMPIDSFAPNLSFFFSNGMDPEYTVIGRVARRIWSIAIRNKYGGSVRSQMLKYHVQTSGRSLHSQDIQFNDIRTTLQALCAIYDNCNSLHTNAFDEAITTPSNESVRRALAIQLIINREWGLASNENFNQGSFVVEELTRLVEEAVLAEFDRITERGGVLGAMETGYQRSKIQEESMYYEHLKHTGKFPIIGVNIFRDPDADMEQMAECIELSRATQAEKESQLHRLAAFKKQNEKQAPQALERLKKAALSGDNIFVELMETVKVCTLGQITQALYDVGGQYRRNM